VRISTRQIALLRGINVGKAKRISMGDLRALVEKLGYGNVRTLLNSGNVIFESAKDTPSASAAKIEKAIAGRLGITARTIVLTSSELDSIIEDNPLLKIATNPSLLLVSVLADPLDRKTILPLAKQKWSPGALGIGKRVAYLWCPDGSLKSPLADSVNRLLADRVTARNWATMLKLQAIANEPA
jgi:uncharacterized protein (DUF1697 family)